MSALASSFAAAQFARVAICGGALVGKSSLAAALIDQPVRGDDVAHLGWSESSLEVSTWFDAAGPWVVEGRVVARALRKWLRRHRAGRPCDIAVFLSAPFEAQTAQQAAEAKGCMTVWRGIEAELAARGVLIHRAMPRVITPAQVAAHQGVRS